MTAFLIAAMLAMTATAIILSLVTALAPLPWLRTRVMVPLAALTLGALYATLVALSTTIPGAAKTPCSTPPSRSAGASR